MSTTRILLTVIAAIVLVTVALYPRYWASKQGLADEKAKLEILREIKRENKEFQKELQKPRAEE